MGTVLDVNLNAQSALNKAQLQVMLAQSLFETSFSSQYFSEGLSADEARLRYNITKASRGVIVNWCAAPPRFAAHN